MFLHVNLAVLSVCRLGPCWSQNHEQHQLDVPKFQNTEDQECPVRSTCLLHIHAPRVSPVLRPNGITRKKQFPYQATDIYNISILYQQNGPPRVMPTVQPLHFSAAAAVQRCLAHAMVGPAVSAHQQCHGILNAGPPWQIGKTTGDHVYVSKSDPV